MTLKDSVAKAQLELLKIQASIGSGTGDIKAEGWDKDPDWVNRGENGRFGGGSSKIKSIEDSVSQEFEHISNEVEKRAKQLDATIEKLTETERDNLYKTATSPESKKVQKELSEKLSKFVSPEAAEAYEETVNRLREGIVARKRGEPIDIEAISKAELKYAEEVAKETGKKALAVGKAVLPAAAILGTVAALGATFGMAGYVLAGAGLLAGKNWSIPNSQGRGGKQAEEAFLVDEKNRKDVMGAIKTHLKGSTSNALYTTGLHTAMLASGVILYQSLMTPESKKELRNNLDDFIADLDKEKRAILLEPPLSSI